MVDPTLDPTLVTSALWAIESAVNPLIQSDPKADAHLEKLEAKWLSIELTDKNFIFHVGVQNGKIRLTAGLGQEPDTLVKGPVKSFLRLAQEADQQKVLAEEPVEISGSTQVLLGFGELANQLEIDWEALLAKPFGDPLGQFLGQQLRKGVQFAKESQQKFSEDLRQYVQYESDWFPRSQEISEFQNQCHELRLKLDRLEAKTRLLEQRIDQTHPLSNSSGH